jgi:hypothetical protein
MDKHHTPNGPANSTTTAHNNNHVGTTQNVPTQFDNNSKYQHKATHDLLRPNYDATLDIPLQYQPTTSKHSSHINNYTLPTQKQHQNVGLTLKRCRKPLPDTNPAITNTSPTLHHLNTLFSTLE